MFFRVSQTISAKHLSDPNKGPVATKGLCEGGGIAFYLGVFGVSRFGGGGGGDRTRLDRKSRDSGTLGKLIIENP